MRDIEFRGKTKSGEWYIGFYDYKPLTNRHLIYFYKGKKSDTAIGCQVIPETVGQYTGLKDKNGVKIFEGDIVKSEVSIGDVQFSHGMFGIEWRRAKADKSMVGSWGQLHNLRRMDDGFNKGVEVIGNCFDNPELLECKSAGN